MKIGMQGKVQVMDDSKIMMAFKWMLDNNIDCPSMTTIREITKHFNQVKEAFPSMDDKDVKDFFESYLMVWEFTYTVLSMYRRLCVTNRYLNASHAAWQDYVGKIEGD